MLSLCTYLFHPTIGIIYDATETGGQKAQKIRKVDKEEIAAKLQMQEDSITLKAELNNNKQNCKDAKQESPKDKDIDVNA